MDYAQLWQDAETYYTAEPDVQATLSPPRFISEACWKKQFHIHHLNEDGADKNILSWRLLDNIYHNRYGMSKHIKKAYNMHYECNEVLKEQLDRIGQKTALEYNVSHPNYKKISRLHLFFIHSRAGWAHHPTMNKGLLHHPHYSNISSRMRTVLAFINIEKVDEVFQWVTPVEMLENIGFLHSDLYETLKNPEMNIRFQKILELLLKCNVINGIEIKSKIDGAVHVLLKHTNEDTEGINTLYDWILTHKFDIYNSTKMYCLNHQKHKAFFGRYTVHQFTPVEHPSLFYVKDEDLGPWVEWMSHELNKKGLKKFLYYVNPFVKFKHNVFLKKEPWARAAYIALQQSYPLTQPSDIEKYIHITNGMNKKTVL